MLLKPAFIQSIKSLNKLVFIYLNFSPDSCRDGLGLFIGHIFSNGYLRNLICSEQSILHLY